MIPGAVNGNPAPTAPIALTNDRRETVIEKKFLLELRISCENWLADDQVFRLRRPETAPIFTCWGNACKSFSSR